MAVHRGIEGLRAIASCITDCMIVSMKAWPLYVVHVYQLFVEAADRSRCIFECINSYMSYNFKLAFAACARLINCLIRIYTFIWMVELIAQEVFSSYAQPRNAEAPVARALALVYKALNCSKGLRIYYFRLRGAA